MREGDELNNFSVRYANTNKYSNKYKTKIETGWFYFGFLTDRKKQQSNYQVKDYISAFKIKATNAIGSGKLNFH